MANTHVYTNTSGYTGEKAPYISPKTELESKQNLVFFREQAKLTQSDAADKLGVSRSYYAIWEVNVSSKNGAIPPKCLNKAAALFKCNPDLINPACPFLYSDKYEHYPPIKLGQDLIFCNEQPQTPKDAGNNLNYFLALSDYSNKSLAEKCGFSESTITKWKSGVNLNEVRAYQVAAVLGCPVDLIYIQRKETPIKALIKEDLQLHSVPTSLMQLKENLAYYIAKSGLSLQAIASKIGLNDYDLRSAIDLKKGGYIEQEKLKDLACVLGFDAKYVLLSSIHVKANNKQEHSFKSNVSECFKIPLDSALFKTSIINFASGGKACDMLPSQCGETIASSMSLNQDSDLHGVCVIGDSMFNYETGKGIQSGFTVVVDASKKDVEQAIGKVVCIRLDGDEMIVKRLKRKNGVLYACSDNPAYEPQQLALPENAELMGTCVGMFSFSI